MTTRVKADITWFESTEEGWEVYCIQLYCLHHIQDPGPSIWVRAPTQSTELMFHVYTDPSPSPRFLVSDVRVCPSPSLHVVISSDTDVWSCAMNMLKAACASRGCYQKWPWPRMTTDPSLRCSVNTTLSGTWTWMLEQCKCKYTLTILSMSSSFLNLYLPFTFCLQAYAHCLWFSVIECWHLSMTWWRWWWWRWWWISHLGCNARGRGIRQLDRHMMTLIVPNGIVFMHSIQSQAIKIQRIQSQ